MVGVSGTVRGTAGVRGNRLYYYYSYYYCYYYTNTEDVKNFEYRAVGECTVLMHSRWVAATRHLLRKFAHAHMSHSYQRPSPGVWTVPNSLLTFVSTRLIAFSVNLNVRYLIQIYCRHPHCSAVFFQKWFLHQFFRVPDTLLNTLWL
jgi:hypothetical protein